IFFIKAFFLIQTIPIWNGRDSTNSSRRLYLWTPNKPSPSSSPTLLQKAGKVTASFIHKPMLYNLYVANGFKYEVHESIQAQRIEASRKSNILVAMGKPM
ncbi:hypothetical protein ACJX0J_039248, partial [Zea mays]